jgi:serine/threonine protein kinase
MKPENLLILNNQIKIADFGLAREIRSVPPYTEYVSTRYYRAPECILKSQNYNSPIDIWAVGCIMAEMYLHPQPLFFGNNEKEVLYRICSILGTPNYEIWNEGIQLAKMNNMKFPYCQGTDLKKIISNASDDAIDLMKKMLRWDPNERATAHNLLNHTFFTNYNVSDRIVFNDGGFANYNVNKARKNSNFGKKNSIVVLSNKIDGDGQGIDNLINRLKLDTNKIDEEFKENYDEDNKNDNDNDNNDNNVEVNEINDDDDDDFDVQTNNINNVINKLNNNNNNNIKNINNNNNNNINDDFNINNDIIDNKPNYINKSSTYSYDNKPKIVHHQSQTPNKTSSNNNKFNLDINNNNNNNNNEKDEFDTNIRLKPINNNPSRRSARKFLEDTENNIKSNNPYSFSKFQYNNSNFTNLNNNNNNNFNMNNNNNNNNNNEILPPRKRQINNFKYSQSNEENLGKKFNYSSFGSSNINSDKEFSGNIFGNQSRRKNNNMGFSNNWEI